jgi:hypothetical protein
MHPRSWIADCFHIGLTHGKKSTSMILSISSSAAVSLTTGTALLPLHSRSRRSGTSKTSPQMMLKPPAIPASLRPTDVTPPRIERGDRVLDVRVTNQGARRTSLVRRTFSATKMSVTTMQALCIFAKSAAWEGLAETKSLAT